MKRLTNDELFCLECQTLLNRDAKLSAEVASFSVRKVFPAGNILIKQGEPNPNVYFVLSGTVRITVNNRLVATRGSNESVGELSLLQAGNAIATATAETNVVVAEIQKPVLSKIFDRWPSAWKALAKEIAIRLTNRGGKLEMHRDLKRVFLASAGEDVKFLRRIEASLKKANIESIPWTSPAAFPLSATTIESLVNSARHSDGAVLVLSAVDEVKTRGKAYQTVRDNIIFEAGLFTGALGRERVACLADKDAKLPSDLLGVTTLRYSNEDLESKVKYSRLAKSLTDFIQAF